MPDIPFLKPSVVKLDSYLSYLQTIDDNHIYTNFGPLNSQFETRIITEIFQKSGYCVTVNNCTSGLMLAINAVKRKSGKYAVMPSFTFSATAQSAIWCGLEPYFIDIDANDWSLDNEKLLETISNLGDDVAVVVPYATFANNIDLAIYEQLQSQGIPVVIDAAPGFGSREHGSAFAKDFSGATVFSFHATKGFGIGEGGLVYSANEKLITDIRQSSNFGFSSPGSSEYLGLNAKLSEYAAAIGLASLDVFKNKVEKRHQLYLDYVKQLEFTGLLSSGWKIQKTTGIIPYQFFSILLPENLHVTELADFLTTHGISSRRYFYPCCHQQPCFSDYKTGDLTVTNDIAQRVISLPLWESLTNEEIEYIISRLKAFNLNHL